MLAVARRASTLAAQLLCCGGGGGGGICVEHPMNCLHARVSAGSPPELRRPWCSPYLAGAL